MEQSAETLTGEVQNTVLALLRSSLWGIERFPFESLPGINWKNVYTELHNQAVAPLCADLLGDIDPENTISYIQSAARNIRLWHDLANTQQKLCQDLEDIGIPCVILKGSSAARYYPQPERRNMGDIDILVLPEDFDRALEYFQAHWIFDHQDPRHATFRRNQTVVELHRRFSTFRSQELRDFLDNAIYNDVKNNLTCTLGRYAFPTLSKKTNGLVLLTHINSHMEKGLGFRQIIDWMMYVDKELDDDVWYREFAEAARYMRLEKLAVTVTRMCQMYLGLREDITWCKGADEELCKDLLDHTFRQGNFGRKLPRNIGRAVGVLSTSRNIPGFFREMQRRGMITWPAAQKHRILRPFAWLYQIFRYIRLGFQKKNPLRYAMQAIKSEKTQGSLLDRLEVSRMNNDL